MKQFESTLKKADGTVVIFLANDFRKIPDSVHELYAPRAVELSSWVNHQEIADSIDFYGYTWGYATKADLNGSLRLAPCWL